MPQQIPTNSPGFASREPLAQYRLWMARIEGRAHGRRGAVLVRGHRESWCHLHWNHIMYYKHACQGMWWPSQGYKVLGSLLFIPFKRRQDRCVETDFSIVGWGFCPCSSWEEHVWSVSLLSTRPQRVVSTFWNQQDDVKKPYQHCSEGKFWIFFLLRKASIRKAFPPITDSVLAHNTLCSHAPQKSVGFRNFPCLEHSEHGASLHKTRASGDPLLEPWGNPQIFRRVRASRIGCACFICLYTGRRWMHVTGVCIYIESFRHTDAYSIVFHFVFRDVEEEWTNDALIYVNIMDVSCKMFKCPSLKAFGLCRKTATVLTAWALVAQKLPRLLPELLSAQRYIFRPELGWLGRDGPFQ